MGIRTHFAHLGHPTVCDGKYSPADLFLTDRTWCERNFLHRYRVEFADKAGRKHEAVHPLPGDLMQALQRLEPCDGESAAMVRGWLSGAQARSWDQLLPLTEQS